jgi:hypothetical protein
MKALTYQPPAPGVSAGGEAAPRRSGGLSGMVWLTWRQHRWALLGTLVLTTLLVGWMAYLCVDITRLYHQCHDTTCPPYSPQGAALSATYGPIWQAGNVAVVVMYAPLLIGLFLGVPVLSREHEQRTLLLAWSQDVSPIRWLSTKLVLLGAFVAGLTVVLSAVSDHLAHVYANVRGGLFDDSSFLATGMLPSAISICWFAIGVAVGAVVRRTLPAMFAVIAGFIAALMGIKWRYPTLMTPLHDYLHYDHLGQGGPGPNALVLRGNVTIGPDSVSGLYDVPGHQISFADLQRMCPNLNPDPACLARNHLMSNVTYQPSTRIPVFHLIVAGGHLGVAAVALVAVWLIVRRTNLSAG